MNDSLRRRRLLFAVGVRVAKSEPPARPSLKHLENQKALECGRVYLASRRLAGYSQLHWIPVADFLLEVALVGEQRGRGRAQAEGGVFDHRLAFAN
jgi:hypothetical protein